MRRTFSFDAKRIADPVHGTIGLSDLEVRVLNTRAFQRLRNVKQLGFAYYVFPGADYSRFSHCVGVCHITGRILEAIGRYTNVTNRDVQLYRLAGLLHDVGHYPYSHSIEDAVRDHYSSDLLEPGTPNLRSATVEAGRAPSRSHPRFYGHEDVGRQIVKHDRELRAVLREAGIWPKEIYSIFRREGPPVFANMVSSDLDADRIDYLLRTAHHTGLPSGPFKSEERDGGNS